MKNKWKCSSFIINLATFFFTLFGILNLLGISYYARGWQEPSSKEGIIFLLVAFIVYKFGNYICDTSDAKVYKCRDCKEVFAEEDTNEYKTCKKCDGKLIEINEYYKKREN